MKKVILGTGTDLSDRELNLKNALSLISSEIGEIVKLSSVYESEPWGFRSNKLFLNMVVVVRTILSPQDLLGKIMAIEHQLGRRRGKPRYSSRIIDIDILLYEDQIISDSRLMIPHPVLHERRFVLVPLSEIMPEGIHPILKKTFVQLLEECGDERKVIKYKLSGFHSLHDNHNNHNKPLSAKL